MNVFISYILWKKLLYFMEKIDIEFSGLGTIEIIDGNFHVTDIFLLKQEGGAASTDLNEKAVLEAMSERDNINFWFHSHVNMGAFWSNTDKETIEMLSDHGFFLSLVMNKKNEYKLNFSETVKSISGHSYRISDDECKLVVSHSDNNEVQDLELKIRILQTRIDNLEKEEFERELPKWDAEKALVNEKKFKFDRKEGDDVYWSNGHWRGSNGKKISSQEAMRHLRDNAFEEDVNENYWRNKINGD